MMEQKPQIVIAYLDGERNRKLLKEIKAGIEEEGVPYNSIVAKGDTQHPACLAYQSAKSSLLDVGVGIEEGIALTIKQLPKDKTLYYIQQPSMKQARRIGNNAGRYVKGLPFKEVGEEV